MKVFPSPYQEWGFTVFSNDTTYWVPSLWMPYLSRCQWDMLQCWRRPCCSRPCGVPWSPTSSNSNSMMPCSSFLATQARFPWKLWPSWRHEVNVISSVTWHLPSRRVRSEICCQILSSTRRIYLRLPLLTLLDMRPGMFSSLEVFSLDLPRRLERLGVGTSLCLRHPGDALNLRLLLLRRRSLNPSSWTRFTPHRKSPDPPRGFFGDSSLSSLCGPVGFRAWRPIIDLSTLNSFISDFTWIAFLMGVISFPFRVLCLGLTTVTYVFTRLLASRFTILHRYVVGMLRYLDDWLILPESRTTGIQARDSLLQVCAELVLPVIAESRLCFYPMTWLLSTCRSSQFGSLQTDSDMCRKSPQDHRGVFLSSHDPPDSLWRRLLGHLSASSSRLRGIGTLVAAGSQVHQNSLTGVCVICVFLPVLLFILGRT